MNTSRDFGFWLNWAARALGRSSAGSPDAVVSAALGVSPRTVRAWRARNRAPRWVVSALMILAGDLPPSAGETWDGWRFERDGSRAVLAGPDGSRWLPDDLYRYRDALDHVRHLQAQQGPGAQLAWIPPRSSARDHWPGDTTPTWRQLDEALKEALRDVIREELRRP